MCEELANDLNVLLRHRLLLNPDGFEGFEAEGLLHVPPKAAEHGVATPYVDAPGQRGSSMPASRGR
jgi:hypothetical protein